MSQETGEGRYTVSIFIPLSRKDSILRTMIWIFAAFRKDSILPSVGRNTLLYWDYRKVAEITV